MRIQHSVALTFAVIVASAPFAFGQSAGCNRARAIVDEVKLLYAGGAPDHAAVLSKLKTAQQLCPTLGEAWKYAYCSAQATGDEQSVRIYKDRAIFNGVTAFECGISTHAAEPLPTYVREKYALVIGIGTFEDLSIPHLNYAAKDAKDFAAALSDPKHGNFRPENVTLLTDQKATRKAILNAIQQLFLEAHEDDLVVLYVSSHGSPGREELGLAGVGYIVTYDTTVSNIWVDAIDYNDFADKVSLIRARRKVAFLDTCYSGQIGRRSDKALALEGSGLDERTAKRFLSGEGTFIIASSQTAEKSWESDEIHNSYFTHFILEALRQGDTPATVKELYDYVATKVADAVAREKHAPQHPALKGTGDVRIGVVPRSGS